MTFSETSFQFIAQPYSNISIVKTDGIQLSLPKSLVVYSISVYNPGPSNAYDVTVQDIFDLTFFSENAFSAQAIPNAASVNMVNKNEMQGSISILQPQETAYFFVTVRYLDMPAGVSVINKASVRY